MAGWGVKKLGELDFYQASTITWLPGLIQGFTTRRGGSGSAPYDSLNLSEAVGDSESVVRANRARFALALSVDPTCMVFAEQVHGEKVAVVERAGTGPIAGVDALITATPGLVLTLLFADCMPIYVVEPLRRVVAIIHAGWRGAAANIIAGATRVMVEQFDVAPRSCQVAIGPSIGADHYEVGSEIADLFRDGFVSGASTPVLLTNELEGRYSLSLRAVAFAQLMAAGYKADAIAVCDEDTYANARDFFSHRREARSGGKTGRMAGFIGLNSRTE